MNTNEQTKPTPRTDVYAEHNSSEIVLRDTDYLYVVPSNFARTLERELNAATRRAEQAEKEREEYESKIINITCLGTTETQFNSVGEMQVAGLYKHKK